MAESKVKEKYLKTLQLIGSLTIDNVYIINDIKDGIHNNYFYNYQQIGSIGNILDHLDPTSYNIKISASIGHSKKDTKEYLKELYPEFYDNTYFIFNNNQNPVLILISKDSNNSYQNTMFVNWEENDQLIYPVVPCTVSHLCYLDDINIETIKATREVSKTVVADICGSFIYRKTPLKTLAKLEYIDFLLISKEHAKILADENGSYKACDKLSRHTYPIIHDSKEIITMDTTIPLTPKSYIDTLGAGDTFAARFLHYLCNGIIDVCDISFDDMLKECAEYTDRCLEQRNLHLKKLV